LVVDSGDLFFEKDEFSESTRESALLKAHLVGRIYHHIGCDALNVGERDLALGVGLIKDLEKKFNLPFVSANLTDRKNIPLFRRYVLKKVNGKTVGIFGVMGDSAEMVSTVKRMTRGEVMVQDTIKSAESVVKELTGKVDLVIALTHQGVGRDWVLARRVPGIDVIVGGHDKQKIAEPRRVEKTAIVQAGEKGQYLGLLQISFDAQAGRTQRNGLIPLAGTIADDSEVQSMIHDYLGQVTDLHGAEQKASAPPRNSASCVACHERQIKAWHATGHAHAYDALVKRGRQFDPDCLPCHTTRFDEPGGFSVKLQQTDLVQVQCESCHGDASGHIRMAKPPVLGRPGKQACLTCHSPDHSPAFEKEYDRYSQKIRH
jgi:hypothetical protein